uniref:Uncharacterized protein n=1 Tax=Timema bartmani TaxID=61472 RepID=A0A7R9ERW7_9NEOP|nr:unnamed protein product [Timema bartmani]
MAFRRCARDEKPPLLNLSEGLDIEMFLLIIKKIFFYDVSKFEGGTPDFDPADLNTQAGLVIRTVAVLVQGEVNMPTLTRQASVKMSGRIIVILCVVMSSSGLPHTTRGGPRSQESSERKLELHSREQRQTNDNKLELQPEVQSLMYDSKLELQPRVQLYCDSSALDHAPTEEGCSLFPGGAYGEIYYLYSTWIISANQFTVKDLRQAYFQISEIVSRIIIPPSSRQPSSTPPPNVTNGTTTEAPYVITQEEVLDIIRRNLGGLVRLFRKEYRLALNDSYKNAQQWNKELRESLRKNLT